jgi:hypothetical protein
MVQNCGILGRKQVTGSENMSMYSLPFPMRTEIFMLCSVQNTRQWTKSRNPVILTVIYHCQNPT